MQTEHALMLGKDRMTDMCFVCRNCGERCWEELCLEAKKNGVQHED